MQKIQKKENENEIEAKRKIISKFFNGGGTNHAFRGNLIKGIDGKHISTQCF